MRPEIAPTLRAEGLAVSYGDRSIITDLDLVVPPGKISVIVGANASGKSTLLRSLARLLSPAAGQVCLDGESIHAMPTRELARMVGLLPQSPVAPEGMTVIDLVGRGRAPHQSWWRQWSHSDEETVRHALELTSMLDLAERPVDELSGGQRQRAWIAMALAQDTDILLLDEPTTFLDMAHQIEVLDLVMDLNRTRGRTVMMVLHDLNQACRYADHIVAMKSGRIVAQGPPADLLTAELVDEVFDVRCCVVTDPVSGTPLVIPIGRHHEPRNVARHPFPIH
ncbi:ABC transporter ATP-binding protein [Actinokineospora xionganensis]|uniref:ABC transporter ATP-binding protein n=1 Tax=Actinokineospora xionganensis TaxID=2684470 RepID=A0ABR7L5R7_9PSEU|nr:ABC transporter ATP-binding protein [Actinokineospora xionganensis]MBC6448019.1 ABC transporter ATP-binding protein [Actinokineospora xionganensis]